ncbi:uncharacterized protein PHACADRAFT_206523 [Phanerochaete carnosa HHB-10118-sp]|uniref:Uncharacterized protein n=1 Tax=Phanerochaete carnosa (strain HHB-10118-sp) TaxID=650164 RepID=K5X475_PHACS|nr:uncharacterized protein PHACADRAFT_206523 [Phanerochaete carnosa HHB-10118-sp]EKM57637.1 hypothetical protein PHACADRAFT_206523 [Phanerochaete carnosa HHB-10118-sp]
MDTMWNRLDPDIEPLLPLLPSYVLQCDQYDGLIITGAPREDEWECLCHHARHSILRKLCNIYPGPYPLPSLRELSCCDGPYLRDIWRKLMSPTPEDGYMINLAECNVTAFLDALLHCLSLKYLHLLPKGEPHHLEKLMVVRMQAPTNVSAQLIPKQVSPFLLGSYPLSTVNIASGLDDELREESYANAIELARARYINKVIEALAPITASNRSTCRYKIGTYAFVPSADLLAPLLRLQAITALDLDACPAALSFDVSERPNTRHLEPCDVTAPLTKAEDLLPFITACPILEIIGLS